MPSHDVIVVGGRVAGAATALQLARRGHRVLVLERARRGSDTLSTHALMRTGVLLLERWGVLDDVRAAGTPPVHRVTFRYRDEPVPIDLEAPLYAPRRTILDTLLQDAAVAAGADVRHGTRVHRLLTDGYGRVTGVHATGPDGELLATAPIIVGADGRQSLVARQVGAHVTRAGTAASAFVYGYWTDVATDGIQYHFDNGISAGLIPTNDGATCVYVSTSADRFLTELRANLDRTVTHVLGGLPHARQLVEAGTRASRLRGFAGVPGWFRRPYGPGWALVGDAGYFKDPQSAHGITDALRDAELLAGAIDDGLTGRSGLDEALAGYERARDDLSLPLFDAVEGIADYAWTLDELPPRHIAMSRAMQRETAHMEALIAPVPAVRTAA